MKFTHHAFIITAMLFSNSTLFSMNPTELTIPHITTFYEICDTVLTSQCAAINLKNLAKDSQWSTILNDTRSMNILFSGIRNKYVNKLEIAAYLGTPAAIDLGKNYIKNDPDSLIKLNTLLTSSARLEIKKLMWENQDTEIATAIFDMAEIEQLQNKPNCFPPLIEAASLGKIKFVTLLLDRGVNIEDTMCPDGGTAVMVAAFNGHNDMLDLLIERRANVNASCRGQTALFLAIESMKIKTVKKLIEAGADITVKNDINETPLQMAQRRGKYQYKYEEIIQALLLKETETQ